MRNLAFKISSSLSLFFRWALMLPIYLYRYSFSAFAGRHCRHEPSCSAYAIEAIKLNGAWRGFWLTLSRVWRCGPGGSHGYDPVPDLRAVKKPLWRCYAYGRWSPKQIMDAQKSAFDQSALRDEKPAAE